MGFEKLEILMEQKGVNAYQVAKETGIATATLYSWKADKYTPKMDKMARIARYFDVPIEYFLEESDGH